MSTGTTRLTLGRPRFLRELGLGAALGTVVGLPLALAARAADDPEWADTAASFALVVGFFLVIALAWRLGMHVVFAYVRWGRTPWPLEKRLGVLRYGAWLITVSTAGLAVWAWLTLLA